jgi:hypothetical protein
MQVHAKSCAYEVNGDRTTVDYQARRTYRHSSRFNTRRG